MHSISPRVNIPSGVFSNFFTPRYSLSAFSTSRLPRSMHGVVPHTMTWYLPIFVRLNME